MFFIIVYFIIDFAVHMLSYLFLLFCGFFFTRLGPVGCWLSSVCLLNKSHSVTLLSFSILREATYTYIMGFALPSPLFGLALLPI